ncbi:MAG: shikimate kinase [Deltaproteobacteria bacterium]|nr:shikimate kinase [Deltaproteobacteria bacterium]
MKNIILTGFMGTGKSSAGKLLAAELGYGFQDIDTIIVEKEKRSINEIFAEQGESYFRGIEADILASVLSGTKLVVSTGGGAVISAKNRELMRKSGIVVNLTASPTAVLDRLAVENDRPLLREEKGLEKIRGMLAEREPYYADADIRIDTTGKNVEDVVQEILLILERGV